MSPEKQMRLTKGSQMHTASLCLWLDLIGLSFIRGPMQLNQWERRGRTSRAMSAEATASKTAGARTCILRQTSMTQYDQYGVGLDRFRCAFQIISGDIGQARSGGCERDSQRGVGAAQTCASSDVGPWEFVGGNRRWCFHNLSKL